MTDNEIIDGIIEREGREYTNHPADRGGPTKFGITLKTLRRWRRDQQLVAKDVQTMDVAEARSIYQHDYIAAPGFGKITHNILRTQLIDFGVTSGPDDAVLALQRVLDVKQDGAIGPVTLAALHRFGAAKCNNLVLRERVLHHAKDVRRNPKQAAFIVGWTNRAFEFII